MMISASKVSQITGVSYETVLRHIRNGDLPAVQTPGGQWRIDIDDAERWWWAMYAQINERHMAMYHPAMASQRIDFFVYKKWPEHMVNPADFLGQ